MSKTLAVLVVLCCFSAAFAAVDTTHTYDTPIVRNMPKTLTLYDVWPAVESVHKTNYWYYLRGAGTLYEAGIDSPLKFLFFTIYRNIVGTFLVISTWDKTTYKTTINTFVRLGNGFAEGSGQKYDPVNIDPFIVTLALQPDEFMVVVNADGSIKVTGNLDRYNEVMGLTKAAGTDGATATPQFDIQADMREKCALVDDYNRKQYWYYLDKAEKLSEIHIPTTEQYYCVFVFVNVVGTFLSISNWNLEGKNAGINTLVRLGNGKADGANYGVVELNPAVLSLKDFRQ